VNPRRRATRHPAGGIICLALAACALPPARPAPAPGVADAPAASVPPTAPAAVERGVPVCVVTPEGELRELIGVLNPVTGDTIIDGRPFLEVHSPEQPQYAAGHPWFVRNQRILTMNHEYAPWGAPRPVDAHRLRRVATYLGVPLFAEADAQTVPHVLYAPVRPGCGMQPFQLAGTGIRFRWPPPWPSPGIAPNGDLRYTGVSAGSTYSCALGAAGDVYCWGEIVPDSGRPDEDLFSGDAPIAANRGRRFTTIMAGGEHSCAMDTDGQAFCSGRNEFGQLGDGTTRDRFQPAPVVGSLRFAALSAGGAHSCALTPEGVGYCWGWNDSHQLGDRSAADRHRPAAVAGALRFSQISAGGRHCCAVTFDGEAYCWGANRDGQLGNGTRDRASEAPAAVSGGLRFTGITAGDRHSCGITPGGGAFCWGSNSHGQLGDGSLEDRPAPTAVAGGLRFASIALGDEHSCGLTPEGVVFCWGRNFHGQLGGVSGHYRETPTRAFGSHDHAMNGGVGSRGLSRVGLPQPPERDARRVIPAQRPPPHSPDPTGRVW
jgi:hypothetical protein